MTYTELAVVAGVAAVVLDRWVAGTRLTTSRSWWKAYGIIVVFQLLTNGWLTGRGIVRYDPGRDHRQRSGHVRRRRAPGVRARGRPGVRLRPRAHDVQRVGVAGPARRPGRAVSLAARLRALEPTDAGVAGPTSLDMAKAFRSVRADPLTFLVEVQERYGDLVAFPVPGAPALLLNDPADVQHVLQTSARQWGKQTAQYTALARVTGAGLLASSEPSWIEHRRLAAAAFHHQRLERVGEQVWAAADGYVVYPAAPPWLASDQGVIGTVHRMSGAGWGYLHLAVVGNLVGTGQGGSNPVAAMPSLHAGTALLVALFLWPVASSLWRLALLAYVVLMAVALVYTGEHYVVDVVAGWLVAGVGVAVGAVVRRRPPTSVDA